MALRVLFSLENCKAVDKVTLYQRPRQIKLRQNEFGEQSFFKFQTGQKSVKGLITYYAFILQASMFFIIEHKTGLSNLDTDDKFDQKCVCCHNTLCAFSMKKIAQVAILNVTVIVTLHSLFLLIITSMFSTRLKICDLQKNVTSM